MSRKKDVEYAVCAAMILMLAELSDALVSYDRKMPIEKYETAAFVGTIEIILWGETNKLIAGDSLVGRRVYGDIVVARVVRALKAKVREGERIEFSIERLSESDNETRRPSRSRSMARAIDEEGNVLLSLGKQYNVVLGSMGDGRMGLREVLDEQQWEDMIGIHERIQRYGHDPEDPRRIHSEQAIQKMKQYGEQLERLSREYSNGRLKKEDYEKQRREIIERMKNDPEARIQWR